MGSADTRYRVSLDDPSPELHIQLQLQKQLITRMVALSPAAGLTLFPTRGGGSTCSYSYTYSCSNTYDENYTYSYSYPYECSDTCKCSYS